MRRLLVRRSLTAVGLYASVAFGFLGTVVAAHELPSIRSLGDYTSVIFATGFFQSFFDLTVEEALVKYGFRYASRKDWGRFRGLFRAALVFKLAGAVLGAIGLVVAAAFAPSRLAVPLLIAAGIPLGQSLEGLAGSVLFLRSRYDVRSAFLAWSMALRFTGIAIGAHFGLVEAIVGVVVAQFAATASVGVAGRAAFKRFPAEAATPLGTDRREISWFVAQSSVATGVVSLRGGLAPLLLGGVTSTVQVALYKIAQAPQTAFQALSAPARMVLLTEQTRDWERGEQAAVLRDVRRYSAVALLISLVTVPPLIVFVPDLISAIYGAKYVPATTAARLFILAAAIQLVVGWSKSLPVTIGRPGLRVWTHGLETVIMLPLVVVFGLVWGAAGAAGAVLVGMCVFAAVWIVVFLRIRPENIHRPEPADEIGEAGALAR
jgi:O-antigen/teichoic acid export membrane protein